MTTQYNRYEALHPYTGSKQKSQLRSWILSHLPKPGSYSTYCEPCAGSAAILLALPRAKKEALIEKCENQAALLKALATSPEVFASRFAGLGETEDDERHLFHLARWRQVEDLYDDDIDRAKYQFIRNCLSQYSKGETFRAREDAGRKTINKRMSLQSFVEKAVRAAKRLQGVRVVEGCGLDWVWEFDSPKSLTYLDPPYLHSTRIRTKLYSREMAAKDHEVLLDTARSLRGYVAVSGFECPLYAERLRGWRKETIEYRAVRDVKVECLWLNY